LHPQISKKQESTTNLVGIIEDKKEIEQSIECSEVFEDQIKKETSSPPIIKERLIKTIKIDGYKELKRFNKKTTTYVIVYTTKDDKKRKAQRSMREFTFFYKDMKAKFPNELFPAFPERKTSKELLTFNELKERAQSLEKLLKYIVQLNLIDTCLMEFLRSEPDFVYKQMIGGKDLCDVSSSTIMTDNRYPSFGKVSENCASLVNSLIMASVKNSPDFFKMQDDDDDDDNNMYSSLVQNRETKKKGNKASFRIK